MDPHYYAGGRLLALNYPTLYEFEGSKPLSRLDPRGHALVSGGFIVATAAVLAAGGGLAVYLYGDWDAQDLTESEREYVNKLRRKIQTCLEKRKEADVAETLGNLEIEGKFEEGEPEATNPDTAIRWKPSGAEVILSRNYFDRAPDTQVRTLLHETHHVLSDNWNDPKSNNPHDEFARRMYEKIRDCLCEDGRITIS